jgi:hypothetical protein
MKYIKYFLISILFFQTSVFANYNDVYIADLQYDWIDKSALEKETIINEIKDIIFENGELEKKENFKNDYSEMLKDKNHKEHYLAASAGYKEYGEYNISAFYYKKQKHIYMYALQNKKNLSKSYYYDALGNLRYVDFHSEEYPEYPHYTIQYKVSGEPVSAIYTVHKDNQYLYEPNGDFKGVWYKHNLYDGHSKVILTRTHY